MSALPADGDQAEQVDLGRLWWVGPLAAAGAALAKAVVYRLAVALGTITPDVIIPDPRGPLTLGQTVVSSAVPALAATLVFAMIGRVARRPIRVFEFVRAIVVVLSFVTPVAIPGAPAPFVLTLLLMHTVAGAVTVGVLTTLGRR